MMLQQVTLSTVLKGLVEQREFLSLLPTTPKPEEVSGGGVRCPQSLTMLCASAYCIPSGCWMLLAASVRDQVQCCCAAGLAMALATLSLESVLLEVPLLWGWTCLSVFCRFNSNCRSKTEVYFDASDYYFSCSVPWVALFWSSLYFSFYISAYK